MDEASLLNAGIRAMVRIPGVWRFVVKSPGDLRVQARRFRRSPFGIDDRRTQEAIAELAAEYEAVAAAVDRLNLVRKRGLSDMGRAGAT
jgi:hypothetical protein